MSRILFPIFACRLDPIRHTKTDFVAASNRNIIKEERDEVYRRKKKKQ